MHYSTRPNNILRKIICLVKLLLKIPQGQVEIFERWLGGGQNLCSHSNVIYDISEEKGNFSFWIYNVMISLMIDCEYKGIPYMLHVTASHEGYNIWNAFFKKRGIEESEIQENTIV